MNVRFATALVKNDGVSVINNFLRGYERGLINRSYFYCRDMESMIQSD